MPSCKELRDALAQCLANSDCVLAGNKPSDCIRLPLSETLPAECKQLKYSYGVCKRNLIDMRKRFRGPMPVNYANKGEENSQLYASLGDKKTTKPNVEGEEESPG